MKIAVVCPYGFDRFGGVQGQAIQLVEWLRDAGEEAWAVAPGSGGPPGTRHVGSTIAVPANRSRAPISLGPGVVRRVAAAVADADVVHVHEPFMPLVSIAAVMRSRAPVVGTFHADPGRGVRALYRLGRFGLRRVAARMAVATAVSPVAGEAVGRLIDVRIVPNGIDVSAYRGDEDRRPHRVVFVGRDEPRKGLAVLLAAWPEIRARVPSAELIVVGALPAGDPIAGVTFAGRVDEEEKRRLLSSAAVLAAPNLGGESFGLVVAEGMSAGCAVVASRLPAFVAVAGEAACYADPGDAAGLAGAIAGLLEDPERRERIASSGVAGVAAFDRAAVLDGYLTAYRDARASAGRPGADYG